jgi:hypothetical protein
MNANRASGMQILTDSPEEFFTAHGVLYVGAPLDSSPTACYASVIANSRVRDEKNQRSPRGLAALGTAILKL